LSKNWILSRDPVPLKGQCHEIFCFWFFSLISFPGHRWQICHRCKRQTMRLISGWGYLTLNLKAKIYIYVNSTIQRCSNKIIKIFLIEDFFICQRCQRHAVVNLELRISQQLKEKIRNGPNGILWGWGEIDSLKKTRSKKSRDTVPLRWISVHGFSICIFFNV
jgi:hypothetical protein